MNQVITAKLLVQEHGYHIRTAQRVIKETKLKLGKDESSDLFASEFIAAHQIKFPKGYGDIQRGKRSPDHVKELTLLKEKSIKRAVDFGLVVGVTYEVTYILLGHYEKTVTASFLHYTESGITAVFEIPLLNQHEREIAMPVEVIDGVIRPIVVTPQEVTESVLIRAVTLATTIGIPTCSILEAKTV